MRILLSILTLLASAGTYAGNGKVTDYVNPFIGTSNYGTTNPGTLCPDGMMSVTPYNVMGFYPDRTIRHIPSLPLASTERRSGSPLHITMATPFWSSQRAGT